MDIDSHILLAAVQRLFDLSQKLKDSACQYFVSAFCKRPSEMVLMQSDGNALVESHDFLSPVLISPRWARVFSVWRYCVR
ncbi:hypothetical protein EDB19DRAFT_1910053 [Suillus lakei]|nr:hypothetical protein EDB19DRAFT_1910053 [Suillus lakei]